VLRAASANLTAWSGIVQRAEGAYNSSAQTAVDADARKERARAAVERACTRMRAIGEVFPSSSCGASDGGSILYTGDGTACAAMCREAGLQCALPAAEVQTGACVAKLVGWLHGVGALEEGACASIKPGVWAGNPTLHDPHAVNAGQQGAHPRSCSFASSAATADEYCDARSGPLDTRFCSCVVPDAAPPPATPATPVVPPVIIVKVPEAVATCDPDGPFKSCHGRLQREPTSQSPAPARPAPGG
jgi:hypothetical protein